MKTGITKNIKVIALILLTLIVVISFVFFQLISSTEKINEPKISPYHADKGEISLLSVGDEIDMQSLQEQLKEEGVYPKISQIIGYNDDDSLAVLNNQQPLLEIEKEPAYFVFDNKEIIYKTYKYDDLVQFLLDYQY